MPRLLRLFLAACIAIAFAYLLLHAREPLRLNLGDPSTDADLLSSIQTAPTASGDAEVYRGIGDPGLGNVIYGAIGRHLGVRSIGMFRIIALVFAALAMLLLFQYARRIWSDTIALIATALFSTSLLWLMYADSLHPASILQATCFLALWGLVRAIETNQRRYYAAAFVGSFACYVTAHDYWVFLPAAVLFTVHAKLGHPIARGGLKFVAICAAGCIAGLIAKAMFCETGLGWHDVGVDHKFASPLSTLVRRYTLVFSPLFWVTFCTTVWRALRAPSLRAVVTDGVTWMLVTAALFVSSFSKLAAAEMLGSQIVLPFFAVGSAILIARLLDGGSLRRVLAIGWLAGAIAWSFVVMIRQPRSVLDRGDVAQVNAYLAANDRNDFVMSNLLSDAHIEASFGRHAWPALDVPDASQAPLQMLELFEKAGTDYVHAVIFTTPESRFIDKSLSQLAMHRRLWSVTGWPHLQRTKANHVIREYDKNVLECLDAVHARKVLHLGNFDVYRIDRSAILEAAGARVPVVRELDLATIAASRHELLGWSEPSLTTQGVGIASIDGYAPCPNPPLEHAVGEPGENACKTVRTPGALAMMDEGRVERAQLMIRVERLCDLRVTIQLAAPDILELSINEYTESACQPEARLSFVVPAHAVHAGINVVSLEKRPWAIDGKVQDARVDVESITIDPICGPP